MVAQEPDHPRAAVNLGIVLGKQGRFEESFKAFGLVLSPAKAYSNVGVLMAQAGRTEEARTAFREALQREPGLPQAQALLAKLDGTGIQTVEHRN